MERLTRINDDGSVSLTITAEALRRLADYEDTGLTPEAMKDIVEMFHAYRHIYGFDPSRLEALAKAENDGRLLVLRPDKVQWINAILEERKRQDEKCGYPQVNTYCEWASILAEETGELCKELNELNFGRGYKDRMEAEAVQVAAVALEILEQSAIAHRATVKAAEALGRLTR